MAKWTVLSTLTILPSTTILPGETVELADEVATILLEKGHIQPAETKPAAAETKPSQAETKPAVSGKKASRKKSVNLKEHEHGTDNE